MSAKTKVTRLNDTVTRDDVHEVVAKSEVCFIASMNTDGMFSYRHFVGPDAMVKDLWAVYGYLQAVLRNEALGINNE